MKKGSRKIILGLLAFFLLLVGMYVYHMNTLREGTFGSQAGSLIGGGSWMTDAHEAKGKASDAFNDAANQMYDAMFQLEPGFNIVDWGRINFSEIKTLENWGRGGEYNLYDRDGSVITQYSEDLKSIINKNSNVTEGSVTISGRDALNQMWDAMSQLEPEFNLLDWGLINFSEIKTLENWGKGGEYQIYDQDGNVMTQYSERLNPTTSQTESPPVQTQQPPTGQGAEDDRGFMSNDQVLRDAQNEYYLATGKEVTRRGIERVNELRTEYPDMPVDLLFYIQEVEEMNGWIPLSERNLEGFMETINFFGLERGTELVRDTLEAEVTLSKPWETNVLNTNETKTGMETSVEFEWNKEMETGPSEGGWDLILGD